MAQGVQRAVVQIRDMVRFFGTVGAEQTALDRVKVKLSPSYLPQPAQASTSGI